MLYSVVQTVYDATIRPRLPRKWGVVNGVAVRSFRLFDFSDTQPDHKTGLMSAIRSHVNAGDTVIDIALGRGISATVAARRADTVHAYEATADMVEIGHETIKHNCVSDSVQIHHAVVETPGKLFGEACTNRTVSVSELPRADVWVLDCEGAETDILDAAEKYPDTCIVESHPGVGVPASTVRDRLTGQYETVTRRPLEPGCDAANQVLVGCGPTPGF